MSFVATREQQEEKRKDYRNVVSAQAALLLVSFFVDDVLGPGHLLNFQLFLVCSAVYLGLLWDLSRNFTLKKWLPRLLGGLGLAVLVTATVYNHFFWTASTGSLVNGALHAVIIGVQTVVLWLGLRDLRRGPRNAIDKLWAAAGLYLMLGIAFSELIHVAHLVVPGSLGPSVPANVQGYHEALYLSFVALTGADNHLDGISHLCRNVLLLESLLSQLYLVMLISGLLLPDAEDQSSTSSTGQ